MNTGTSFASYLRTAFIVLLLAGCSDEPETTPAKSPSAPGPSAPASIVPLDPRYEATLAEGIDFSRPGYPSFLKEVHGVSGHETWGRWTDANVAPTARIRFARSLPKRFTLELQATGLGPNAYQPVIIRVGTVEKSITLGNPPKDSYRIEFDNTNGADQVEIIPPAPILPKEVTPQSADSRRLGIGLKSLKILN